MGYKFSGSEYNSAVLDLLVMIYAKQEALTKLVIDEAVNKGADADKLVKTLKDDFLEAEERIKDVMYKEFGHTDLSDILGDDES